MFNINDDQAKIQLNNFWSYLDEMAEKNPEEYKKFISQQMKQGAENLKKEKEEQEDRILKIITYACLRFKLLTFINEEKKSDEQIHIHNITKNEISEVPKILFSSEFQSKAYGNKIIEEPKVYLNILHSPEYTRPTDDNGSQLNDKDVKDDNKWKYIPTQFRYIGKKSCMSGKRCDFYDVIINSLVIERIGLNEELRSSIIAYVVRKFIIFLENKYKLFTDNVKILKHKKYKSIKNVPEDFKLEAKKNIIKNDEILDPKKETIPAKNFYDENNITIPSQSENYPNTNTFYNLTKPKPTKPGSKNKPDLIKTQDLTKKILIEEIKNKKMINIKKTILSESEMEVKFDFSEFEEITIDKIDLQISEKEIKLKLENTDYIEHQDYDSIDMKFSFNLNVDYSTAKFNKIEKTLKLILNKI